MKIISKNISINYSWKITNFKSKIVFILTVQLQENYPKSIKFTINILRKLKFSK